jgi:hypothetical protein
VVKAVRESLVCYTNVTTTEILEHGDAINEFVRIRVSRKYVPGCGNGVTPMENIGSRYAVMV